VKIGTVLSSVLISSHLMRTLCVIGLLDKVPRHPIRNRISKGCNWALLLFEEIFPSLTFLRLSKGSDSSQYCVSFMLTYASLIKTHVLRQVC